MFLVQEQKGAEIKKEKLESTKNQCMNKTIKHNRKTIKQHTRKDDKEI